MTNRSGKSEVLAFLGIARRAGALVVGTDAVRRALRNREVRLLILAQDGSSIQRKKLVPLAEAGGVSQVSFGSMAELGAAVGAGPLAAIGVVKPDFARELSNRLGCG